MLATNTPKAAPPLAWVRYGSHLRAVEGVQKFVVECLATGSHAARVTDTDTGEYAVGIYGRLDEAKAFCEARRRRFARGVA